MTGSQPSEQFDYLIQAQVRQADLIACKRLQDSLQQAALHSKGYLGQETFYRQLEDGFIEYNVRLRFSDIQSCLAWIDSPIRRRYLHQAESRFVHQFRSGIHEPSFDLWLTSQLPDPPPIWKMNLLVWLVLFVYPAAAPDEGEVTETLGSTCILLNCRFIPAGIPS